METEMKEYTDFNLLFKTVYQHVKNNKCYVRDKLSPPEEKNNRLLIFECSDGEKFAIPVYLLNQYPSPAMNILQMCLDNKITLTDLINKQLLPFI